MPATSGIHFPMVVQSDFIGTTVGLKGTPSALLRHRHAHDETQVDNLGHNQCHQTPYQYHGKTEPRSGHENGLSNQNEPQDPKIVS